MKRPRIKPTKMWAHVNPNSKEVFAANISRQKVHEEIRENDCSCTNQGVVVIDPRDYRDYLTLKRAAKGVRRPRMRTIAQQVHLERLADDNLNRGIYHRAANGVRRGKK